MVQSNPHGKYVFMSWEAVIMRSGVFKSLWSEQDGDVQQGLFNKKKTNLIQW